MKRSIAVLLALIMLFSLCACGGAQTANSPKEVRETDAPAEIKKPEESAEASKQTGTAGGTEAGKGTESGAGSADATRPAAAYTLADEVIVDDENCSFVIRKAEDDPIWGFTLKAECENRTSDKTLMFGMDRVSVNGYMSDPVWAKSVGPGEKESADITFSSSDFEEIGITSVDEIVFTLNIYDNDDWSAEDLVDDVFAVYPTGLRADEVVCPERRVADSEQVLFDTEEYLFILLGQREDGFWGYTLDCYIENRTDRALMFSWADVSVNGYMIDPYWATEIAPGMKKYSGVSFSSEDFEEAGITSADEIRFSFRVYDPDDWFADDIEKTVRTIYPTGLRADEVVYPARKTSASEQIVVDNDKLCFIVLGERDDSFWGYTLDCYIENRTDASLTFSWDGVSVNGYMIDPYWATEIAPGMRQYCGVHFSSDDFEDNGIAEVEEIDFSLRVYDYDDWSVDESYGSSVVFPR